MTGDGAPGFRVPATEDGARLVDVLREHLGTVARREVGPLIAREAVSVDGHTGRIAEPVDAGAVLTVDTAALADLAARDRLTEPSARPLVLVHEDDDLLVVDKPAGIHVHPMGRYRDDTLLGAVLTHAGARAGSPWTGWRPYPAHRLDRATSGLMAFAKSAGVQDAFRRLLDERRVERVYRALVEGAPDDDAGTVDIAIGRDPERGYRRAAVAVDAGGQEAVTHWRVVERREATTLVELRLGTGRTHQIRTHLAAIGHPVVGDTLYADTGDDPRSARTIALRAVRLSFPHPRTGAAVDLTVEGSPEGG